MRSSMVRRAAGLAQRRRSSSIAASASSVVDVTMAPLPTASPSALTTSCVLAALTYVARRLQRRRRSAVLRVRDVVALHQLLGPRLAAPPGAPPPCSARTRRCPPPRGGRPGPRTAGRPAPRTPGRSSAPAPSGPQRRGTRRSQPSTPSSSGPAGRRCAPTSGRCRRCPAPRSSSVSRGDCASFQAIACSRPPEPMSRTLIADDRHRNADFPGGVDAGRGRALRAPRLRSRRRPGTACRRRLRCWKRRSKLKARENCTGESTSCESGSRASLVEKPVRIVRS